jgi:catechol 2,3-dioxygenase-like lactoylglutathione lyase family enzyme
MAHHIGLTLDCADPAKLAEFWKLALGYEDQPPPAPFKTREEWLASFDLPEDDEGDGAWLHDPTGAGPTLSLLQVPEPKVAKNRLHIDIRVSRAGAPEERWKLITETVAHLTAAGASVVREDPEHHVVMADPEGNEFCVA